MCVHSRKERQRKLIVQQGLSKIPKLYATLKAAVTECIDHVRFDEEAKKVFTSDLVRTLLREVMSLVLRSLELIKRYYTQSKTRKFSPFLYKTRPNDK